MDRLSALDASFLYGETTLGAKVCPVAAERDIAALDAVFARSRAELGSMDVLICGAAGNFLAPAEKLSANGFKAVVDIDLLVSLTPHGPPSSNSRRQRARSSTSPPGWPICRTRNTSSLCWPTAGALVQRRGKANTHRCRADAPYGYGRRYRPDRRLSCLAIGLLHLRLRRCL
jgi:NAD(P)-dependent dehydrogenase (short-subunit alcohol dehydrogenase family)